MGERSLGLKHFQKIITGILPRIGDNHVRSEHIAEQHVVLNDLCVALRKSEPYIEGLLKDIQPLAQPCSLKDIVPQNSVSETEIILSSRGLSIPVLARYCQSDC